MIKKTSNCSIFTRLHNFQKKPKRYDLRYRKDLDHINQECK